MPLKISVQRHLIILNGWKFFSILLCFNALPTFLTKYIFITEGLFYRSFREQVVDFCIEAGLDPFICEFQQGYATIIHENSANLSGGQQQLIALARALYRRPQVLLLDEATAAMDRRSEQFVLKLLQQKKKEMMVVFVTHRVQLARHTDYIYVIENKQIAASGTHEEVVCSNGLYREAFEEIQLVNKL